MENLRGIALMIFAMASFTTGDMFLKMAAGRLDVPQILLTQAVIGTAIFWLMVRTGGQRLFGRDLLHWAVIWRVVAEIFGTTGIVMALSLIAFSSVSAITQAMPLVVTLGAALILKEHVGWRRWIAILIGLSGVLIIIRPGAGTFDANALWAVLATIGFAMRDLLSRPVPRSISTARLSALGFLSLVPAGLVLMPFFTAPIAPDGETWTYLILMIAFTMIAYFAITAAMRLGEVSAIAPFRYARLIFAMTVGILVFGDRPDAWTYLGAAITVAAGLYAFLREARVKA